MHLDDFQQPAAQRRIEVRQIAERHVRHRVQRASDPAKPATLIVRACAGRINDRRRDHLAEIGNEAVSALDLIRDVGIGHLDIGHHGRHPMEVRRADPPAWSRPRISQAAGHTPPGRSHDARPDHDRRTGPRSPTGAIKTGRPLHPCGRPLPPAGSGAVASRQCGAGSVRTSPAENQRPPHCVAIAAARAASIAGRQRGSDRAGSRHLAAGSRLRLRACRCRSGCNQGNL